jgi:signal transduction histidine kinase
LQDSAEEQRWRQLERSEDILRFLLEAREALASSLDYETTLRRVAELAVPRLADWCAVDVALENGSLRRLAVTHVDPAKVELAYELERRFAGRLGEADPLMAVMRTGKARLLSEVSDEVLRGTTVDDEHFRLLRSLGLSSAMLVPLSARGARFGLLTFAAAESGRRFGPRELELALELARHAAVIIDNARLYSQAQQELAERERVQSELTALNAELEDRVARRTAELQRTNEELEAFSYSVSHDLRAPLRAIHGFSRIVVEDHADGLAEDAVELLNLVQENATQMGQLIDDLLAFSRLSRQPLNRKRVQLASLVKQVLDGLLEEAAGRQVDVEVADLPEVVADPSLLRQLLVNLLSNALKYSRKRDVARIEVGWEGDPGRPVYFVRDNGAGFDMRYVGKLFGVFQRLHLAEEYEGTGVGLALVQRIVARHGGRVWAEGELGRGATFYFTIPAPEEASDD